MYKAVFGYDYSRPQENLMALKVGPNCIEKWVENLCATKPPKTYPPKTSFYKAQPNTTLLFFYSFIPSFLAITFLANNQILKLENS